MRSHRRPRSRHSRDPVGHADFARRHLQSKMASHRALLERIPSIPDLQCAWLILLFCASTRIVWMKVFLDESVFE